LGAVIAARADPHAPPIASAGSAQWTGHASYVLGYKMLNSKWSPIQNQLEFGVLDLDLRPPEWPVSLCAQLLLTYADSPPAVAGARGDYSGTWEINLGVRKVLKLSDRFELFVGGGLAVVGASASSWVDFGDYEAQVYEDSDMGIGAWGGAGVCWNLSDHWHLGAEVQYSWGEVDLFDERVDAGGFHVLAMFGYHW
jgi:opacity protein-like surface antigen